MVSNGIVRLWLPMPSTEPPLGRIDAVALTVPVIRPGPVLGREKPS